MSQHEAADGDWESLRATIPPGAVLVTDSAQAPWGQALLTSRHVLFADEVASRNGRDSGPNPHELVLMALGACTAITLRMYAARKAWPIERVAVRLNYRYAGDDGPLQQIERRIEVEGPLDEAQRKRLLEIAEKCPVHRMLSAGLKIHSTLGMD